MCQWAANRNPWPGYQMGPFLTHRMARPHRCDDLVIFAISMSSQAVSGNFCIQIPEKICNPAISTLSFLTSKNFCSSVNLNSPDWFQVTKQNNYVTLKTQVCSKISLSLTHAFTRTCHFTFAWPMTLCSIQDDDLIRWSSSSTTVLSRFVVNTGNTYWQTRSWPQWWSGHSTTTHTIARSVFTHLGLWRKLYDSSLHHFTASQPMHPKMCCIGIFVDLQPVGWNLKGGFGFGDVGCLGWPIR